MPQHSEAPGTGPLSSSWPAASEVACPPLPLPCHVGDMERERHASQRRHPLAHFPSPR